MNRENQIEYNGKTIPYELTKSKIKNMYIYVKNGKVTVKAPVRLKDKQIRDFVNQKSKWIYEKIEQDRKRTKKQEEIKPEEVEKLEVVLKNSIEKYAKLLKEIPNKVRIKDIQYAWGSCSSNRNITINKKLAGKDEKVIEYVILHEMCHLKYMNHSKQFWTLVEAHMPEYKKYRNMLKEI